MKYELKPLPYAYDALEPWIDARTVEIHHDKHQATYVAKLNAALESCSDFVHEGNILSLISHLESVPAKIMTAVRNNGGGAYNHAFYWDGLSSNQTAPSENVALAINEAFGSFDKMKSLLSEAAINRFGSGWAWLCSNGDGDLSIISTPNQDNPVMGEIAGFKDKLTPLFTIDVWEHAYYLKYQNRRNEYVENIFNIINWDVVNQRYFKAIS